MNPAPTQKYANRLSELEALHAEVKGGKRPGDGGVVAGLMLEAAGDVVRRASALGATVSEIGATLEVLSETALHAWASGLAFDELQQHLQRAASRAVEAALPDSDDDGERLAQWALQDLRVRDRLESALVALERLDRSDARQLSARLRAGVLEVDLRCRRSVLCLTALNGSRRAEAALLDEPFRAGAWWFSERTGIDDDRLVAVLGGEGGSLPPELSSASATVTRQRARPVSFDELFRFDLGLASPAEREAIRLQADADPELALALAAMDAAETAINEESPGAPAALTPVPESRGPKPEVVETRAEFKLLVLRTPKSVQVVVQPRHLDGLAAAAVYRDDAPDRAVPSAPGPLGTHFELGAALGGRARVVVKLADGRTEVVELELP